MSPRRVFSALALFTAIGCGGGDESGPTGSIQLTASPSALTLQQGGTGTVTVTLVRGGGFADPVNVTVTGLPSGVTLSVTPAQLTGTTTQAVVTVNVASTVPAGTYTATVTGTATGIGSTTVTYSLTVTATPTYALTATLVGKTDSVGSDAANMRLSQQRAAAVRNALLATGKVPAQRIQTRWTGERPQTAQPISDAADASNRVVDIGVH